jgi:hypothetical protein
MKKLFVIVLALIAGCQSFDYDTMDITSRADRLRLSEAIIEDADILCEVCERPELISDTYRNNVCEKEEFIERIEDYLKENEFEEQGKILENNIQSGYDKYYNKKYQMHVVSAVNDSNLKFTIIYMKYEGSRWSLEYIKDF